MRARPDGVRRPGQRRHRARATSGKRRHHRFAALAQFALDEKIDLTVVGPEAALAAGAVDLFRARGLRIFGPTKAAAELESSKAFAKAFMQRHAIPTAKYDVFDDAAAAHRHVDAAPPPIVVKADGLAAGKGVVVAATRDEAHAAVEAMLGGSAPAGSRVVIEEFLDGEEASFIVVCDGRSVLPLATSQDHKRLGDDDRGPNTGGMGAYSPAPVVTPNVHARVMQRDRRADDRRHGRRRAPVHRLSLRRPDDRRPRHAEDVEFNCRLGDPGSAADPDASEDRPVRAAAASGGSRRRRRLDPVELQWDRRVALGVVMAAAGYPAAPRSGDVIGGAATTQMATAMRTMTPSRSFTPARRCATAAS